MSYGCHATIGGLFAAFSAKNCLDTPRVIRVEMARDNPVGENWNSESTTLSRGDFLA